MKPPGLNLAVLLVLLAHSATVQSAELGGKVYHHDENGTMVPEKVIGVSIDEVGLGDLTNDQGVFVLPLLHRFKPGDRVTLSVDKRGWQIFDPPGGRFKIPRTGKEFILVRLLPEHSREFNSFDRLENLYRGSSEKAKQEQSSEVSEARSAPGLRRPRSGAKSSPRVREARVSFAAGGRDWPIPDPFAGEISKPADAQQDARRGRSAREDSAMSLSPDFDRYIREWAAKYGFSEEEVRADIARWITDVEIHRDDAHRLGLAAFAKKQFAEAALRFRDSARERSHRLKEAIRPKEETAEPADLREELVDDLRLEGDSLLYLGDSQKALASYQEAHSYTSREEAPALWAATLQDTALAHARLASESPPIASAAHIAEAVGAYRQTLLVYTHERLPRPWAMTQNNLGVALVEQASISEAKRGNDLLAEAVAAYRQALLVYTRDRLPLEWAKTRNNLAIALRARAARAQGGSGAQLLAEAVDDYRQALQVRTREQFPESWARLQNNLGVALRDQASSTGGERGAQLLAQAVDAYRQALQVRSREQFPQQWARTQDNLGSALQDQALQVGGEDGAELLTKAVQAFRQALLVRTYEQFPQDWAMTQNNLGSALRDQASQTDGKGGAELLTKAVHAFRQALVVRTQEDLPQQWAMTQTNLGNALRDQGLRTEGEAGAQLLAGAVEAYKQALLVRTRAQLPQDWAATLVNLGAAFFEQAARAEGERKEQLFDQALEAYRQAQEVPKLRAIARRGEAQILLLTGKDREAAAALSEILARNPQDSKAFSSLALLLNNRLFDPVRALSIIQRWLTRHPEDQAARILEIEALFASGAFADCRTKAAALRTHELATQRGETVLLGYQLAAGLAAGSPAASADLAPLLEGIAKEPPELRTSWDFRGALHSLERRSDLLYRDWLARFFQALAAPNRDATLQELRVLQEELGRVRE